MWAEESLARCWLTSSVTDRGDDAKGRDLRVSLPSSATAVEREGSQVSNQTGAMHIEMSSEYYIEHLRKINRSLASQWSPIGTHHRHLNDFIRAGVSLAPAGSRLLDAGCGLSI